MTHNPMPPLVDLAMTAGIFLAITGLPGLYLAITLWDRSAVGRAAAVGLAAIWAVAYPQGVWRWYRHGQLQEAAAERADCLGYGSMMPDRCVEVMRQPSVVPDGFAMWSGILLAIAVAGLAAMFAPEAASYLRTAKRALAGDEFSP